MSATPYSEYVTQCKLTTLQKWYCCPSWNVALMVFYRLMLNGCFNGMLF